MAQPKPAPDPAPLRADDLYERDFYAWTQEQAAKLRGRGHNAIDWENVAEEIESLGRSEQREIESRLSVLLFHLLKWRFQPERRGRSWRLTILEQRRRIARELRASPSLRDHPGAVLSEEYEIARLRAAEETGLDDAEFPEACPFSIEEILDAAFFPEPE